MAKTDANKHKNKHVQLGLAAANSKAVHNEREPTMDLLAPEFK